ncbi:hypothetical protein [Priestia megaterium]|uniref:Uncharacterized protein n=1 Tax=Priestia megaterium TaxID=1404 RepID=A0A6M6E2D8_PRIMG|nr:hypothetical protein [Priestia megaterium]QJX80980.1 hypothetical protein FDZ14_33360 [Priestia megaterium]
MEFLQKDEIFAMAQYSDNLQDGVILMLSFDQLTPEEIRNIKVEDVETLTDRLSNETMKIIKGAIKERKYIDVSNCGDHSSKYELKQSEYVVRGAEDGKVSEQEVHRRAQKIFNNYTYKGMTLADIRNAGKNNK